MSAHYRDFLKGSGQNRTSDIEIVSKELDERLQSTKDVLRYFYTELRLFHEHEIVSITICTAKSWKRKVIHIVFQTKLLALTFWLKLG